MKGWVQSGFLPVAALVLAASCGHAQSSDTFSSGHSLWHEPGAPNDRRPPQPPPPRPASVTFDPVEGSIVRSAYIIPSNRTAQSNAVEKIRFAMAYYREWYREQMERHGFGPRTFNLETEADGVTPKVYVVNVAQTDDYLRGDIWGRTISAASSAGIPVWSARQLWWLVSEAHLQTPDGSVTGGTALGAGFGSGDDAGVGMMGGDGLARFTPVYLTNNTAYANRILPEIGPYRLVQDVSFPWFEGSTFSSVSSSVLGAGVHELSHGLGLPHDFRNDNNFNGNLMGNGLRGIRGNLYPNRYRSDLTRIAYGSALALSVSRYFNPPKDYTDNSAPSVNILTRGSVATTNGLLHIRFAASDATALSAAWLTRSGDLVGEMPLDGLNTNTIFTTPYYDPGVENKYTISVFDSQGNKRSTDVTITPQTGANRAPEPFITLSPPTAYVGQNVTLNGSSSSDPDGASSALRIEWDLDGDGTYDTAPSGGKTLSYRFALPGDFLVRARLTDAQGAQSVSAPLALRVIAPTLAIEQVLEGIRISWPSGANGFVLQYAPAEAPLAWAPAELPPMVTQERISVLITNASEAQLFRLAR